jgi:hypothetical protein
MRSTKAGRFYLALAILIISTGCDKAPTTASSPTSSSDQSPSETEVSGMVYIVTEGADAKRLPLVTIRAIPEADITSFLRERTAAAEAKLRQFESEMKEGDATILKMNNDVIAAAKDPESNPGAKLGAILASKTTEAYTKARENMLRRQQLWPSAKFICENLPPETVSTSSDVDGRFRLSLPSNSKFAIAAAAKRATGATSEEYYWLVWVETGAKKHLELNLTNLNLMTATSPEVVFHTKCLTVGGPSGY